MATLESRINRLEATTTTKADWPIFILPDGVGGAGSEFDPLNPSPHSMCTFQHATA